MKTIASILIILATVTGISCKEDEPEITASIVGSWQGDYMDAKVSYGVIVLHEEEDDNFDGVLEFRDDGTVSFTRNGDTSIGTYQLNGSRLTTNVDFQVEGVQLSTFTFDVVELTQSRLELQLDQDQDVQVPDIGMVETNIKANLTFDRL